MMIIICALRIVRQNEKSYDDVHGWLLGHPGSRDGGGRGPDEEADRGRGEGGDQEGKVQPAFCAYFCCCCCYCFCFCC